MQASKYTKTWDLPAVNAFSMFQQVPTTHFG